MNIRHLIVAASLLFSSVGWASHSPVQLSPAPVDRFDMDSIKRGAKFFAANCMSCHTLVYLKYDKVAKEAGITLDKMPVNVANWPNGVTPPDLSLEKEIRGLDWIYTYLHSFYQDASRPTGSNNILVPGSAMPNILSGYQGQQILVAHPDLGVVGDTVHWFNRVKLVQAGSMTPDQFDAAMADVVNFLGYAAEPYYIEQHRMGWWILGFLSIFFVFIYALKKEYWRDVKKRRDE